MRERRTYGSVRGLRREPLVYSTIRKRNDVKTRTDVHLMKSHIDCKR